MCRNACVTEDITREKDKLHTVRTINNYLINLHLEYTAFSKNSIQNKYPTKNKQETQTATSQEEIHKWQNTHEKMLNTFIIKEMHMKNPRKRHYTPGTMTNIKNIDQAKL